MMGTQLTKRGEPKQGTTIEIRLDDEVTWETCKIVGKGWATDGRLVWIVVEWADGVRQQCPNFEDLYWRAVA